MLTQRRIGSGQGAVENGAVDAPGRVTFIPLPREALHEAVACVDDLLELKVVLVALRSLAHRRPEARWVTPSELMSEPSLEQALSALEAESRARLVAEALASACKRGLLACGSHRIGEHAETRITLNNVRDRQALAAAGWSVPAERIAAPAQQHAAPRSNIFELYEQNIGMVTPLLAEELQEAERTYPPEWVQDAFREAVGYNKRNWRYVRRILENWATEGKDSRGAAGRRAEAARNRRRNRNGRF